jgi:hypothetical protein
MIHSTAEVLMAYLFASALFIGLPAITFTVVFLPGLMRTTGETIGSSRREDNADAAPESTRAPSLHSAKQPLTMANTA